MLTAVIVICLSLFDDDTDVPLAAQTLAQKLAIGVL